jgi:CIC family chloride channel protein
MTEFSQRIKLQNALQDDYHLRPESTGFVIKNIFLVILCASICWSLIALLVAGVSLFLTKLAIHYERLSEYTHSGDFINLTINALYLFGFVLIFAIFRGMLMSLKSWQECEGGGLLRALKNFHNSYKFLKNGDPEKISSKRYKDPTLIESIKRVFITFLTIAPSGSGGLEGPVFHVGESVGAFVAKIAKVSSNYDLRMLQVCGIAAAIGTLFNAPLTAALFSIEVIYTDRMMSRKIFYSMIAAWVVSNLNQLPLGLHFGFHYEPKIYEPIWLEYPLLILMSLLVSNPIGMGFFKLIDKITELSQKFSSIQKAMIGSLACAAIVLAAIFLGIEGSYIAGTGENVINDLLHHKQGESLNIWYILLLILGFKLLATSVLVGFGGSAGLLFPTIFLGGVSGAATFFFLQSLGLEIYCLELFIVAGIASVLTVIIESPLAALGFVFEVFDPNFAPPIIISCAISYLFFKKQGVV